MNGTDMIKNGREEGTDRERERELVGILLREDVCRKKINEKESPSWPYYCLMRFEEALKVQVDLQATFLN